ncbi:MAG TPA: site-2 protease family protein [Candidatus Paceibacterota bacterium]|jgi:Zn-dependent protease|nr:site-2 protease family protein [Candidatus Paceibacterota bacterium]
MDIIFGIAVLAVSVILHEVAHGYMANWLGDPTARLEGRLTLNPLSHIDPMGSLLLPAILVITHSPILIGYAKPVPYNPYNLRGKYAEGLVAFAGPATNIILALIFGLSIRFFGMQIDTALLTAFGTIAYVNMLLALFNLIPVPPLDGSKVLSSICLAISPSLARGYDAFRLNFEKLGVLSGTLLILAIFYFLSPLFSAALLHLFGLLTGVPA